MTRRRSACALALLVLVPGSLGCGDSVKTAATTTPATSTPVVTTTTVPTTAAPTTTEAADFTITSSPEFVQRVIPGRRPIALVSVAGEGDNAVALTATASLAGTIVEVQPASLAPGAVAEVWATLPESDEEIPVTLTVSATRGERQHSVAISFTAVPGTDDLQATASEIAAVFLRDLAGQVPGLPADTAGLTQGTPVAGLLVVTHYAWFTDQLEIGLAWHIMVAPDDFAELYVRPRGEWAPRQAFRIDSWSTALAGGDYALTEVAAPTEVTR